LMSLYWHDYETFGTDPARDRPAQFAGLRTDEELNIVGEPLVIYCRPPCDSLPQPESCLVTHITPLKAEREGLNEAEFIAKIERELAHPGTCGVGYNSIRFDDEFTRNILYRNFFDPYAREWQNGCSRWDIIDMMRLMRAFRPEGMEWPLGPDGRPSFRLEELTAANGIAHESAHDALSDVRATIDLARLVRKRQPKLYDYVYKYRDKKLVSGLLALRVPLIHVSSMYPSETGSTALVLPIATHPVNRNEVVVYDLSRDPSDLLHLDATEIRRRIFTPKEALDGDRIPLKTIHVNKCPIVATEKLLTPEIAKRLGIDVADCHEHAERIMSAEGLEEKIEEVFSRSEREPLQDPDLALYGGGFFSNADRAKMEIIRSTPAGKLGDLRLEYDDARISEMLFRYRARNYPETLSSSEQARWKAFRESRLDLDAYMEKLSVLRSEGKDPVILDELESWARSLKA
ncbi:MAG TPA: exodeoxyribonuclease I, partial [Burkholderiales bacterium]|nr:exodeoxyribonuclease I [Burkholderiales bacterium]